MKDSLRRFKAEIFQALAHPTRIAMIEALGAGEMSAGKLMEQLELEQANASQHLSVLRAKRIVVNRKVGNQVFYSLRDPVLIEILDILRRYFSAQLTDTMNMLEEIGPKTQRPRRTQVGRG
jgi:DNA-binding transcriptional ArsR family regulator